MNIVAAGGLDALATTINVLSKARDVNRADSYISYTQPARVEPIVMVDTDVLYSDLLPDTMQTLLSVFAAYYLQAFSLSVNVGNINVIKQLDKLNPTRDPVYALGARMGLESFDYTHKLPMIGEFDSYAMESGEVVPYTRTSKDVVVEDKVETSYQVRDPSKEIKELSNLAVGKLLNVEIQQGEQKAVIPVSVRLMTNSMSSDNLVHILSTGSKDTSFTERWHGYKSGRLELFRDLILCQDLIDAHKKTLLQDKSGVYANILARRSKNTMSALVSGEVSIGSASNLCVISSDTAAKLESALLGKLSNFKVREKVFEETYLMILVVLDKEWDRATFYYRGLPETSTASARDLKAASKSNGTDVMSILSAFREGKSVAL